MGLAQSLRDGISALQDFSAYVASLRSRPYTILGTIFDHMNLVLEDDTVGSSWDESGILGEALGQSLRRTGQLLHRMTGLFLHLQVR